MSATPAAKTKKRNAIDLNKIRAARYEKTGPGPIVKFGKNEFQCPPEVPFSVLEAFSALETAQRGETAVGITAAMRDTIVALLGDSAADFMKENPSTEDMAATVEAVLAEYGVSAGESSASPSS